MNDAMAVGAQDNQIGLGIRFRSAGTREGNHMMDFDELPADFTVELPKLKTTRHAVDPHGFEGRRP